MVWHSGIPIHIGWGFRNTDIYRFAEIKPIPSLIVNKDFVCSTAAAQAIFEFITGDKMSTTCVTQEASAAAARDALNCPDCDVIVDMRRLNARPKSDAFDKFWAKMGEVVEGRVNDRRHGDKMYMPVATYIPNLIKLADNALEREPLVLCFPTYTVLMRCV